jgi:hypothetical protein
MLSVKELQSGSIHQWESFPMHITVTVENAATNHLHNTVTPQFNILAFCVFGDFIHFFVWPQLNAQNINVSGFYTILDDPNKHVKSGFYCISKSTQ